MSLGCCSTFLCEASCNRNPAWSRKSPPSLLKFKVRMSQYLFQSVLLNIPEHSILSSVHTVSELSNMCDWSKTCVNTSLPEKHSDLFRQYHWAFSVLCCSSFLPLLLRACFMFSSDFIWPDLPAITLAVAISVWLKITSTSTFSLKKTHCASSLWRQSNFSSSQKILFTLFPNFP